MYDASVAAEILKVLVSLILVDLDLLHINMINLLPNITIFFSGGLQDLPAMYYAKNPVHVCHVYFIYHVYGVRFRFPFQVPGDRQCGDWEVVHLTPVYREQM